MANTILSGLAARENQRKRQNKGFHISFSSPIQTILNPIKDAVETGISAVDNLAHGNLGTALGDLGNLTISPYTAGSKLLNNLDQRYNDGRIGNVLEDAVNDTGNFFEEAWADTTAGLKPDIPNSPPTVPAMDPNVTNVEGKKKRRRSSIDELRSGLAATIRTRPEGLGVGGASLATPSAGKAKLGQ